MARQASMRIARLIWFAACVNEAVAFKVQLASKAKVASKQDIMRNMTAERAVRLVLGMHRTHAQPGLAALIQEKLGHRLMVRHRRLRTVRRHLQDPKGYAAVGNAKDMLNAMIEETNMKLELESTKCEASEAEQMQIMEDTQQDIASFNSLAAEARGHVLKAQGAIMMCNDRIPQIQEELAKVERQCTKNVAEIKANLRIVVSDIEVMSKILEMSQCGSSKPSMLLIQCPECGGGDGNGAVMLQEDSMAPLLKRLRSQVARQYLQDNLARTYHEAVADSVPVMLTQERVTRMRVKAKAYDEDYDSQAPVVQNTSDVPQSPEPYDCVPTTRCTMSDSPDCDRLRDRFLLIQSGIYDKKNELEKDLVDSEDYCQKTMKNYADQGAQLEDRLREEQTNLAMATKDQVDAESQSRVKAMQHTQLINEYQESMKQCCDNQNQFRSEACALERTRGELFKMAGQNVFISDCEVSDWKPQECTVTCGGGSQTLTRSVIVNPVGGAKCPPLVMQRSCNSDPCPVDCVLADWSGWSACSAECGGGVQMRARSTVVEMAHGGQPCGATEETEPCNIQSCDQDCVLSEWSAWSSCSKMCGGGTRRKTKNVQQAARGTGTCFAPDANERLQFENCNVHTCASLLPAGRYVVRCNSKIDVVLLIDGSGSLGSTGWQLSKRLGLDLVAALMSGSSASVNLAVQLFSGPTTWANVVKCTSSQPGVTIDLHKDCGIQWVTHFSTERTAIEQKMNVMQWPSATTLTSVALSEAANELQYGRENTNAVVIVITDGKPMSDTETKVAALRLQQKARVLWVPVGSSAPLALIKEMATKPEEDHVVPVSTFQDLSTPKILNAILANTCPRLE